MQEFEKGDGTKLDITIRAKCDNVTDQNVSVTWSITNIKSLQLC